MIFIGLLAHRFRSNNKTKTKTKQNPPKKQLALYRCIMPVFCYKIKCIIPFSIQQRTVRILQKLESSFFYGRAMLNTWTPP